MPSREQKEIEKRREEYALKFLLKVENIYFEVLPCLAKFKAPVKTEIARSITQAFGRSISLMNQAMYLKNKKPALKEAQAELEMVRFFLKALNNIRCLSNNFYHYLDCKITEASKMMGSYMKKM